MTGTSSLNNEQGWSTALQHILGIAGWILFFALVAIGVRDMFISPNVNIPDPATRSGVSVLFGSFSNSFWICLGLSVIVLLGKIVIWVSKRLPD